MSALCLPLATLFAAAPLTSVHTGNDRSAESARPAGIARVAVPNALVAALESIRAGHPLGAAELDAVAELLDCGLAANRRLAVRDSFVDGALPGTARLDSPPHAPTIALRDYDRLRDGRLAAYAAARVHAEDLRARANAQRRAAGISSAPIAGAPGAPFAVRMSPALAGAVSSGGAHVLSEMAGGAGDCAGAAAWHLPALFAKPAFVPGGPSRDGVASFVALAYHALRNGYGYAAHAQAVESFTAPFALFALADLPRIAAPHSVRRLPRKLRSHLEGLPSFYSALSRSAAHAGSAFALSSHSYVPAFAPLKELKETVV